jgi:hypothetical protein
VNWRDGSQWTVVAAGVEVVTGLVLAIYPPLFGWLLFGAELSGAGQAMGRLAGFSLLALALACWPGLGAGERSAARALILFSLLSAIYLFYLGFGSELVGPLLWPAAALHAALTILLVRQWFDSSKRSEATAK